MEKTRVQELVDQVSPGGTLKLHPPKGELRGPVVITCPMTVQGQQCTIWASRGPVLCIESDGTALKDLNIRVTGRSEQLAGEDACAIVVVSGCDPSFDHVAVHGNVSGIDQEEGEWRLPRLLRLGLLRAEKDHVFKARLVAPAPCKLDSSIAGLSIQPSELPGGDAEITLKLDPFCEGVRLRGDLTIRTPCFTRYIRVTGRMHVGDDSKATVGTGQCLWNWEDYQWASSPVARRSKPSRPPPSPSPPVTTPRAYAPKSMPLRQVVYYVEAEMWVEAEAGLKMFFEKFSEDQWPEEYAIALKLKEDLSRRTAPTTVTADDQSADFDIAAIKTPILRLALCYWKDRRIQAAKDELKKFFAAYSEGDLPEDHHVAVRLQKLMSSYPTVSVRRPSGTEPSQ